MKLDDRTTLKRRPFNTPIETGLRALVLLIAIKPKFVDLHRLVYYDYLLVHSGDVNGGPESLHPAVPHRSGEWLVRRELVSEGLDAMFKKELIQKRFNKKGITYGASELTGPFLDHLSSNYAKEIRQKALWVISTFEGHSDYALSRFMESNLGKWGAEFKLESLIRELEI